MLYFISESYLQINGVDYNDNLLLFSGSAKYGQPIDIDNDLVYGVDGLTAYGWACISITGGTYIGEKWTIIYNTNSYPNELDLENLLDQVNGSLPGVGNYIIDYHYGPSILWIEDPDGGTEPQDYSFNLPTPFGGETINYTADSNPTGYLDRCGDNYVASLTYLSISGVEYNDRMFFVLDKYGEGEEHRNNNDSIGGITGMETLDWVCISITGGSYAGEKWTLLCNTGNLGGIPDLQIFLNQNINVGEGNYTIDYQFLGGDPNVSGKGEGQNFDFSLPSVGSYASGSDPVESGYLDSHGHSGDNTGRSVDVIYFEEALSYIGDFDTDIATVVVFLFSILSNPLSIEDVPAAYIDKAGYFIYPLLFQELSDEDFIIGWATTTRLIKKLRR